MDLDQGRSREAALQSQAAYAALEAELGGQGNTDQGRTKLKEQGEPLGRLAMTALGGELGEEQVAQLEEIVVAMERVARRRRHFPGDS
jgi:hypothetical protein